MEKKVKITYGRHAIRKLYCLNTVEKKISFLPKVFSEKQLVEKYRISFHTLLGVSFFVKI